MKIYNNNYINNILLNNIDTKYLYHYLYIISHIRTYRFKDRRYNSRDYIPINVDILRKILIYNKACGFLRDLVDLGLIETDYTYSHKERKSRGYRLTEVALNDKFFLCKETDKKLQSKIKRVYTQLKLKLIEEDIDGRGYVTECMENLKIDSKKAFEHIKDFEDDPKEYSQISIENFNDKFATVDKTGNRLHNNLTNLHTPLRKYLSYDGKKLVQCDIRNSQIVFLYTLLDNYHIPKQESDKFKSVVCDFGFYEFFAEKLGVKLTEENRKEFKEDIFKNALFGTVKTSLSKIEEVFSKEFPMIFYLTRKIKENNHKELAIKLQKAESEFIFNCVRDLKKQIPLLTIHDSICTTEGNESIVYNKIMENFKKYFNISPKIKVEKFA